jgi:hypothetical protein
MSFIFGEAGRSAKSLFSQVVVTNLHSFFANHFIRNVGFPVGLWCDKGSFLDLDKKEFGGRFDGL